MKRAMKTSVLYLCTVLLSLLLLTACTQALPLPLISFPKNWPLRVLIRMETPYMIQLGQLGATSART